VLQGLVEDRLRRRRTGDDRRLVSLGDGGDDLGVSGPEWGEQEIDLVVGDQLFGELGGALAVRLVIVLDQLDLGLGAPDIDAAGRVDLRQPHLPDHLLFLGLVGERPRERKRRPDLHVRGLRCRRQNTAGRNACGEDECAGKSSGR
jgi:hypothetical protein